ncbi:MAG: protein translocase subunit SecF, partial [Christensenellales bacterium]
MKKINFNNVDFISKTKIWILIPLVIIIAGAIVMATVGMNLGIDFTGGGIITVALGEELDGAGYNTHLTQIREIAEAKGVKVSYAQKTGEGYEAAIQVRYTYSGTDEELISVGTQIVEELKTIEEYNAVFEEDNANLSVQSIGATASSSLLKWALISISIAIVVMLIYIGFRFDWLSGLAAVIALFHDTLIMIALTTIFRIQVNTNFIAAIITIIAYSINASIILFDRVRGMKKLLTINDVFDPADIANKAIRATMTRTIYTSLTTLFTIVALAIFGV